MSQTAGACALPAATYLGRKHDSSNNGSGPSNLWKRATTMSGETPL